MFYYPVMISDSTIQQALAHCVSDISFRENSKTTSGKVRDIFPLNEEEMLLVVSDRISAFDFILGTVPYKGQVLNQIAAWWFKQMDEIGVHHHFIDSPHPNVSRVKVAKTLPIEVIVRGYLTGTTTTSAWYAYEYFDRMICGIEMPGGMQKNQPFENAIITPTTKPKVGHDKPISEIEIVENGLVDSTVWEEIRDMAQRMFAFGQRKARENDLILVDTKYEFGIDTDGRVMVIDEVHTPDSSRYWLSDTYMDRVTNGKEPEMLDKEFVRRMVIDNGYQVESDEDPKIYMSDDIRIEASKRYIRMYEKMTGNIFVPAEQSIMQYFESL